LPNSVVRFDRLKRQLGYRSPFEFVTTSQCPNTRGGQEIPHKMQRVDSLPHASRARRLRGPLVVIAVWVMGHGSWDRDRGFCGLFEGSNPTSQP
jgi:hypothetical protein